MKKIELNGDKGKGKFLIVDDDKYEHLITNYNWHIDVNGYAVAYQRGSHKAIKGQRLGKVTLVRAHRVIMNCPDDMVIDHINGMPLDCRVENLRICTRQENQRNKRIKRNKTVKYKGVYFKPQNLKKQWYALIGVNNKSYNLGTFNSAIDAAHAYDKKAKELFGEFAHLNFK